MPNDAFTRMRGQAPRTGYRPGALWAGLTVAILLISMIALSFWLAAEEAGDEGEETVTSEAPQLEDPTGGLEQVSLPSVEGDELPILAIIIDDWGYGWEAADDFLALDAPLNIAVIPHLPLSRSHAERAFARGHQVLLHLPMEPLDSHWVAEAGSVTTAMSDASIVVDVVRAIDAVPHISAVNNHMGSKATADARVMAAVLGAVADRGLYFVDSRTTPDSVVAAVAGELGVAALRNDHFIDPDRSVERIKARVVRGAEKAKDRGWAIVIGHVRPETYKALVEALPEIEALGVRLGRLDEVAERAGIAGSGQAGGD